MPPGLGPARRASAPAASPPHAPPLGPPPQERLERLCPLRRRGAAEVGGRLALGRPLDYGYLGLGGRVGGWGWGVGLGLGLGLGVRVGVGGQGLGEGVGVKLEGSTTGGTTTSDAPVSRRKVYERSPATRPPP